MDCPGNAHGLARRILGLASERWEWRQRWDQQGLCLQRPRQEQWTPTVSGVWSVSLGLTSPASSSANSVSPGMLGRAHLGQNSCECAPEPWQVALGTRHPLGPSLFDCCLLASAYGCSAGGVGPGLRPAPVCCSGGGATLWQGAILRAHHSNTGDWPRDQVTRKWEGHSTNSRCSPVGSSHSVFLCPELGPLAA